VKEHEGSSFFSKLATAHPIDKKRPLGFMTRHTLITFLWVALSSPMIVAQQLTLPNGAILTGTLQTNAAGDHVQAFRGIPYAKPPVGVRRWKQATLKPLNESLNATSFGKICYGDGRVDPQSSLFPASEDCLFLNVYTPVHTAPQSKLPVMVWVHGGAFVAGAANIYDGSNLIAAAHNNVIVVTLNYRLAVFGLLSGDTLKREGHGVNYALRDQEVAFQWVKLHIPLFGGDPDRITAFGESAGAKSVFAHLISRDGTQQLFHRAILQSGTLTTAHDVPTKVQQNLMFSQVAAHVGCNVTADDATLLASVRAANTSAVWAAGSLLRGWQPVVDDVFLKDAPLRSLGSGKISRVPTIVGTNTDEGWLFTTSVKTSADVMPFVRSRFSLLTDSELARLEELYPSSHFPSARLHVSEIYGDAIYECPSKVVSQVFAQFDGTATFRYRFNQTSTTFGPSLSVHTAEIRYVFNMVKGLAKDPATQAFVAILQRYWTAFAQTGSPNGESFTFQSPRGLANTCESFEWPSFGERPRAESVITTPYAFEWSSYDIARSEQIVLQSSGLALETMGASVPLRSERCAFWQDVEQRLAPTLAVA
jgi:para-nitrobenzyl esterase